MDIYNGYFGKKISDIKIKVESDIVLGNTKVLHVSA